MLQRSMKEAAENRTRQQLEKLEQKGNHNLTTFGQLWMAKNLVPLAEYIFSNAKGFIKSYVDFPKKYKGISAEDYYFNKDEYDFKLKKNPKTVEDHRINNFIEGTGLSMARARTVSLIALTAILNECLINRKEATRSQAMNSMRRNLLQQLSIYFYKKGKEHKVQLEPSLFFYDTMSHSLEKKVMKITNMTKKEMTVNDQLKQCMDIVHYLSEISEDITLERRMKGKKTKLYILANDKILNDSESVNNQTICTSREYRPMITAPRIDKYYNSYSEGLRCKIVNSKTFASLPEKEMEALDRIQSTAQTINPTVLSFLKNVKRTNTKLKKFNLMPPKALDPKTRPDKSDPEALKKWQQLDDKIEAEIKEAFSINKAAKTALEIAQYYQDIGQPFYFPCYMDYRGRAYYLPTTLNPQASKPIKALIMRAEAERVGEEDFDLKRELYFIAIAGCLANVSYFNQDGDFVSADGDKTPWNVRVKWVEDRLDFFCSIADDPMKHIEFLQQQEDPAALVGYCSELRSFLDNGPDHMTQLYLFHDGSCNAYQHSAAYLLDRNTGDCVNMLEMDKDATPNDMYGLVATDLRIKIPKSEMKYRNEFIKTKIATRKSCKRITMCLGYGLTEGGAFNYGKEEINKFTEIDGDDVYSPFEDIDEASKEFSMGVLHSVEAVAPAVTRGKEAIQLMAELCAGLRVEKKTRDGEVIRTGVPFEWTTGLGFKVSYNKFTEQKKTVSMMVRGSRRTFVLKEKSEYSDKKQLANSSSPNYTHSRDAEHMKRTVLKMDKETPWLMVHDSFGTTMVHIVKMYKAIREAFVEQYQYSDPLKELFEESLVPVYEQYSDMFDRYMLKDIKYCSDVVLLDSCLTDFMLDKGWKKFDGKFTRTKGGRYKKDWTPKEKEFERVIKKMMTIRKLSTRTGDLDLEEVIKSPYFFI